jgi:selenocysteine-specific elongation factor
VAPPLRVEAGAVTAVGPGLTPRLAGLRDRLRLLMDGDPMAAPDAEQLRSVGATPADLAALGRAGELLRVAEAVVLPPGADDVALERLRGLEQPFTVSAARTALGTSRRVVLPLLGHLDRTGRTVRLADDRRRLRSP